MQTKRTLSRSTLTVQDMTVASALQPSLPSMNTPRCDLRPTPGTALQPTKRSGRCACPGTVARLTVSRLLCRKILGIPAGFKSFDSDANMRGLFAPQQVESNMAKNRQILLSMTLTNA